MTPKRLFYALLGSVLCMIIGSFGFAYLASNWLTSRSTATINLKLDILELRQNQKKGVQASNNLIKYKQDIANLDSVIPTQKDQVDALNQLLKIGDENNITFGSVTFPSSELGNAVAAKPAAATVDETKKADDSSKSAATTPAAPAAPKKTVTQAKPVDGVSGVYEVQVSLGNITQKSTNKGVTYDQLLNVLRSIEQNRRIMQMTNISITPQKSLTDTSILYQLTINLKIYLRQ